MIIFQRTRFVGLCGNLNHSLLDPLDYARFIELAWVLGPKAFTYGKINPRCNLLIMCS